MRDNHSQPAGPPPEALLAYRRALDAYMDAAEDPQPERDAALGALAQARADWLASE